MRHVLNASMFVPVPLDRVFGFFADAANLQRITPPELHFSVATAQPLTIGQGSVIDYRLKLIGIPFTWRSLISEWQPPHEFVDEQLRGPYRYWHHRHRFFDEAGGTRIDDQVHYELPLSPLGDIAWPLVRIQLGRIFRYRQKVIRELLTEGSK